VDERGRKGNAVFARFRQSALSAAWRKARNASFKPWLTALSGS
jgi:hypothetical protein